MKLFSSGRARCMMALGVLLLSGVILAGCGGSGSSTGGGTESSGTETSAEPSGSETTTESSGVDTAAVEEKLQPFFEPPTEIGIEEPLKELPTGKTLTFVEPETPPCKEMSEGMQKAAGSLGIKYKIVSAKPTPQNQAAAVQQVAEEAPEVVALCSIEASLIKEQLQELHAAGTKVVDWATSTPPPGAFDLYFLNDKVQHGVAEAIARYAILKGEGKANLLYVDQSVIPFAKPYGEAMQKTLEGECPECSFSEIDTLPEEIASKIPTSVVSELQKDPSTNWISFAYGAMSLGTSQAFAGAGVGEGVQIINQSPEKANFEGIKSGFEAAGVSLNYEFFMYYVTDSIARMMVGQKTQNLEDKFFHYIVEKPDITFNVNTEVWNPLPGFQGEFEEVWGVKK